VAVVYALIIGFLYRELTIKELPKLLVNSIRISSITVLICGVAKLLSVILSAAHLTRQIGAFLFTFISSPISYIVLLMIFLFIVGCLLDTVGAIIIIAPIMVPFGIQLGIDPLYLGVLFVTNLVIGMVTPPFGYNIFTGISISKLSFEQVVKGTLPFLAVEIFTVVILAAFPGIITWLPNMLKN
jgi:C4-dicarboxylate transporter DctM subunit